MERERSEPRLPRNSAPDQDQRAVDEVGGLVEGRLTVCQRKNGDGERGAKQNEKSEKRGYG